MPGPSEHYRKRESPQLQSNDARGSPTSSGSPSSVVQRLPEALYRQPSSQSQDESEIVVVSKVELEVRNSVDV